MPLKTFKSMPPTWACMPPDLLVKMTDFLPWKNIFLSFLHVCKAWREQQPDCSSLSLPASARTMVKRILNSTSPQKLQSLNMVIAQWFFLPADFEELSGAPTFSSLTSLCVRCSLVAESTMKFISTHLPHLHTCELESYDDLDLGALFDSLHDGPLPGLQKLKLDLRNEADLTNSFRSWMAGMTLRLPCLKGLTGLREASFNVNLDEEQCGLLNQLASLESLTIYSGDGAGFRELVLTLPELKSLCLFVEGVIDMDTMQELSIWSVIRSSDKLEYLDARGFDIDLWQSGALPPGLRRIRFLTCIGFQLDLTLQTALEELVLLDCALLAVNVSPALAKMVIHETGVSDAEAADETLLFVTVDVRDGKQPMLRYLEISECKYATENLWWLRQCRLLETAVLDGNMFASKSAQVNSDIFDLLPPSTKRLTLGEKDKQIAAPYLNSNTWTEIPECSDCCEHWLRPDCGQCRSVCTRLQRML